MRYLHTNDRGEQSIAKPMQSLNTFDSQEKNFSLNSLISFLEIQLSSSDFMFEPKADCECALTFNLLIR